MRNRLKEFGADKPFFRYSAFIIVNAVILVALYFIIKNIDIIIIYTTEFPAVKSLYEHNFCSLAEIHGCTVGIEHTVIFLGMSQTMTGIHGMLT